MTKEELTKGTSQSALRVFKFLMKIDRNKGVDVILYQLFKASSSVAANHRNAAIRIMKERNQNVSFPNPKSPNTNPHSFIPNPSFV